MSQPSVCLSFDWDGVSVWMAGGASDARSLSRGEFGPRVGVPRLLELCDRLGVTATFFAPGHTVETFPETAAAIAAAGHEIAAHGYVHEDFEQLSLDEARARDPPGGGRHRGGGRSEAAWDAVPTVGGAGRALRHAARGGLHVLLVGDGRRASALGACGGRRPP